MFLLLAVFVLGSFGKELWLSSYPSWLWKKFKAQMFPNQMRLNLALGQNVETIKLKPKQHIHLDCGVSKKFLLR